MTQHYYCELKDLTARDIKAGWDYHKKQVPEVYITCNEADWAALTCWNYVENNIKITPEIWCVTVPEPNKTKVIQLLKDFIILINEEK